MVAITATNMIATIEERTIEGKKKRNRVKLVISATEGLTYPSSGGLPIFISQLPSDAPHSFGKLGMTRNIDYVIPYSYPHEVSTAGGYIWHYAPSTQSFKGYMSPVTTHTLATAFPEMATTVSPSDVNHLGLIFYVEAVGW